MNYRNAQRPKPLFVILLLLIVLVGVSGCVGQRIGVSWAGLTVIGEEQNILVTYNDLMVMVDPITGDPIPLLGNDGEERRDADGNLRVWRMSAGEQGIQGGQFYGSPLRLDDDTLLVADHANLKLVEVDIPAARIDDPAGTTITGKVLTDLISDGTRLFLPFELEDLQAINLNTMDVEWTLNTENNGVWTAPLLHEDTLYVSSMDQHLYAIDAASGEQNWQFDLEGAGAGTPVLYNDRLYTGSFARKVFAVSLEGEKQAEYVTENWVWGAPSVVDDTVYVADLSGYVYALDATDLSETWKVQIAESTKGIRAAPLVTDEFVIVATREGHVVWLNRENGQEVYKQEVQAEILSDILIVTPVITVNEREIEQPTVVISTVANDKLLIAFDLNDSSRKWSYPKSG